MQHSYAPHTGNARRTGKQNGTQQDHDARGYAMRQAATAALPTAPPPYMPRQPNGNIKETARERQARRDRSAARHAATARHVPRQPNGKKKETAQERKARKARSLARREADAASAQRPAQRSYATERTPSIEPLVCSSREKSREHARLEPAHRGESLRSQNRAWPERSPARQPSASGDASSRGHSSSHSPASRLPFHEQRKHNRPEWSNGSRSSRGHSPGREVLRCPLELAIEMCESLFTEYPLEAVPPGERAETLASPPPPPVPSQPLAHGVCQPESLAPAHPYAAEMSAAPVYFPPAQPSTSQHLPQMPAAGLHPHTGALFGYVPVGNAQQAPATLPLVISAQDLISSCLESLIKSAVRPAPNAHTDRRADHAASDAGAHVQQPPAALRPIPVPVQPTDPRLRRWRPWSEDMQHPASLPAAKWQRQ